MTKSGELNVTVNADTRQFFEALSALEAPCTARRVGRLEAWSERAILAVEHLGEAVRLTVERQDADARSLEAWTDQATDAHNRMVVLFQMVMLFGAKLNALAQAIAALGLDIDKARQQGRMDFATFADITNHLGGDIDGLKEWRDNSAGEFARLIEELTRLRELVNQQGMTIGPSGREGVGHRVLTRDYSDNATDPNEQPAGEERLAVALAKPERDAIQVLFERVGKLEAGRTMDKQRIRLLEHKLANMGGDATAANDNEYLQSAVEEQRAERAAIAEQMGVELPGTGVRIADNTEDESA